MKIIAHRGDVENFPQNTLVAFENALLKGADSVELDVHLSLDKKVIVHHDYDLKYPTGGKGLTSKKNSSYIRTLDAGSWLNPKFSSEKIPFLEEVFIGLKDNILYEIELKGFTEEFVKIIMDLVDRYHIAENIEFTSPHPYLLTFLKKEHPFAKIGSFIQPLPEWMDKDLGKEIILSNLLLGGIDVAHFPISLLSTEYVDVLKQEGIVVHAADCDSEDDIKKAFDLHVDKLSTNKLSLALSIKKSYEQ